MITNSMAILLTMTLPRLFIFFKVATPSCIRVWHSLQSKIRFQVQLIRLQSGSRLDAFESTPLVLMPHSGVLHEPGAASSGIRNRFRIIYRNFQNDKIGFASVTTLILIFFSTFVGLQILAILMVQIVSGSDALSISPTCGYWRPDPNLNRSLLVDTDAETRAASWVDTCYDDRGTLERCKQLPNRTTGYKEHDGFDCPFANHMCRLGNVSALQLDTGIVSSAVLGINIPSPYFFRRRTTCAPLNVDEPYIRYESYGANTQRVVEYYYDEAFGNSRTWSHPIDSWRYTTNAESADVPIYSLMWVRLNVFGLALMHSDTANRMRNPYRKKVLATFRLQNCTFPRALYQYFPLRLVG